MAAIHCLPLILRQRFDLLLQLGHVAHHRDRIVGIDRRRRRGVAQPCRHRVEVQRRLARGGRQHVQRLLARRVGDIGRNAVRAVRGEPDRLEVRRQSGRQRRRVERRPVRIQRLALLRNGARDQAACGGVAAGVECGARRAAHQRHRVVQQPSQQRGVFRGGEQAGHGCRAGIAHARQRPGRELAHQRHARVALAAGTDLEQGRGDGVGELVLSDQAVGGGSLALAGTGGGHRRHQAFGAVRRGWRRLLRDGDPGGDGQHGDRDEPDCAGAAASFQAQT
ncbi:MAG: hypothetical protein R3F55_09970 [Alphaproteobacteria bacterium]